MDTARIVFFTRLAAVFFRSVLLSRLLSGVTLLALGASALAAGNETANPAVVFVCEHGSAKSVIAAEQFNLLSTQRGLPYRAISRGITPDDALQEATRLGLQQDGIDTSSFRPRQLNAEATQKALRVVTIGLANDPDFLDADRQRKWDDVPAVSKGYDNARDDLRRRIDGLLNEMTARGQ